MFKIILLAVSLSLSCLSFAQSNAADKLIELTNSKEAFRAAFMVGFKPFLDKLAHNDKINATQIQQVKQAALDFSDKIYNDKSYSSGMRQLYNTHFNEAELAELLRFYSTPTGQKALKKLPLLFKQASQIGKRLAQKYQSSFQQDLKRILGNSSNKSKGK